MKEGSRANALLVELLLVIFFFMISAAILVQVFADAKLKSRTAKATNASMLEAQNIAEDLYAGEDPDAILASYGFRAEGEGWAGLGRWAAGPKAGFSISLVSFSFLFQINSNLFEFKPNLNSTPMHPIK